MATVAAVPAVNRTRPVTSAVIEPTVKRAKLRGITNEVLLRRQPHLLLALRVCFCFWSNSFCIVVNKITKRCKTIYESSDKSHCGKVV